LSQFCGRRLADLPRTRQGGARTAQGWLGHAWRPGHKLCLGRISMIYRHLSGPNASESAVLWIACGLFVRMLRIRQTIAARQVTNKANNVRHVSRGPSSRATGEAYSNKANTPFKGCSLCSPVRPVVFSKVDVSETLLFAKKRKPFPSRKRINIALCEKSLTSTNWRFSIASQTARARKPAPYHRKYPKYA